MQQAVNRAALTADSDAALGHDLKQYRIFGLNLASDFVFANHLVASSIKANEDPDCVFVFPMDAQIDIDPQILQQTKTKFVPSGNGNRGLGLYRFNQCDLLRLGGVDFLIHESLIEAYLHDEPQAHMVEIGLLGAVLAFWLERAGLPALHASSVVIDEQAIAFLAQNTGGKTTLAASFVQSGYPLLSDDIVPIEQDEHDFLARPAYPTMRMWPEQADFFVGSHKAYDLVHPQLDKRRIPLKGSGLGEFCTHKMPLKRIYLPRRSAESTDIQIEPVSPSQALIELLRHSFIPGIVSALGWQPRRLGFLKHLVQQAPMRQLVYPAGYEYLPEVREVILRDLEASV